MFVRGERRWLVITLAVACLIGACTVFACWPSIRAHTYSRFRGAQPLQLAGERTARLYQLQDALSAFRDKRGTYPRTMQELTDAQPSVVELLQAPRWAIDKQYSIDFSALHDPEDRIVIDDPGYNWPGAPAIGNSTPPSMERFRRVLTNDGVIRRKDDSRPAYLEY